jgi:hypothetical protein
MNHGNQIWHIPASRLLQNRAITWILSWCASYYGFIKLYHPCFVLFSYDRKQEFETVNDILTSYINLKISNFFIQRANHLDILMHTWEKGKQKWYNLCSSSVYYQHLIPFSPKTPRKQLFSHERASTHQWYLTLTLSLNHYSIPPKANTEPPANKTQRRPAGLNWTPPTS